MVVIRVEFRNDLWSGFSENYTMKRRVKLLSKIIVGIFKSDGG